MIFYRKRETDKNFKSKTSYSFFPSSKIVSFPTIPISAAPYSTYVTLQDYIDYANRMGLGGILHLDNNKQVHLVRAKDGAIQKANLIDFLRQ